MNKRFWVVCLLPLFANGCASVGGKWYDDWKICAAVGAVTGGVVGAVDQGDHLTKGAVAGGVIGALLCQVMKPGDADGDGVPDDRDRCPGTPQGVKVNAFGCEVDSDADAVPDSKDRCPDTPKGARVNAFGCELDSDGDGVVDGKDNCPNTPPGAKVNSDGCELDSDGDGVVDGKDNCPNTPPGAKVNSDGCELDSDGDGVVDSKDRCPGTAAGAKVNSDGCELDSDGDGVVDSKDKCPGTAAGKRTDSNGCELPAVMTLKGVNFEFDSSELTGDTKPILDDVTTSLKRHPDMIVEVAGHTDSVGTPEYNQGLSQRRAESVMRYLIDQGVKAENLNAVGYGLYQPIASNDNDEGRAQNRRVELRIK